MNIGIALTFMFNDRRWPTKMFTGGTLLAGALVFLPLVVGLGLVILVAGYMLETLLNVRDRYTPPLPNWWQNPGGLFVRGLRVVMIWGIYNTPALLVSGAALGINLISPFLKSEAAATLGAVGICLGCLQFSLSLLGNGLFPAALIHYARWGTLGAAFQLGEIVGFIRHNLGDYLLVILVVWFLQFVALFGVIGFGVGVGYTFAWVMMVAAHLYGQLARRVAISTLYPREILSGGVVTQQLPATVGRSGKLPYNLLPPPPGSRPS